MSPVKHNFSGGVFLIFVPFAQSLMVANIGGSDNFFSNLQYIIVFVII